MRFRQPAQNPPHSLHSPLHSWLGDLDNLPSSWGAEPRQSAFGRLWRTFMTARITIATVLVVLQAFIYALGNVNNGWSIAVCVAYLCATLQCAWWQGPSHPAAPLMRSGC